MQMRDRWLALEFTRLGENILGALLFACFPPPPLPPAPFPSAFPPPLHSPPYIAYTSILPYVITMVEASGLIEVERLARNPVLFRAWSRAELCMMILLCWVLIVQKPYW